MLSNQSQLHCDTGEQKGQLLLMGKVAREASLPPLRRRPPTPETQAQASPRGVAPNWDSQCEADVPLGTLPLGGNVKAK